jgi:hydroxyacyl-ACP dehydratase HTD2-like protein with hotdog domain
MHMKKPKHYSLPYSRGSNPYPNYPILEGPFALQPCSFHPQTKQIGGAPIPSVWG